MLKRTLVYSTIFVSISAGSVAAASIGYDPEDESKAFASPAKILAAEYGGAEEANAMLTRAAAAVMTNKSGAIKKFNSNDPQFRDRDLFVFCFNAHDGKYTAHEAMVGADVRLLVDGAGRKYGWLMLQNAHEGQVTEVDYASPIPGSTKIVPKRAFVTRIADQVCGVSAYRLNNSDEAKN
jgi:hypothetical protein